MNKADILKKITIKKEVLEQNNQKKKKVLNIFQKKI